jgi:hypothetical protein
MVYILILPTTMKRVPQNLFVLYTDLMEPDGIHRKGCDRADHTERLFTEEQTERIYIGDLDEDIANRIYFLIVNLLCQDAQISFIVLIEYFAGKGWNQPLTLQTI